MFEQFLLELQIPEANYELVSESVVEVYTETTVDSRMSEFSEEFVDRLTFVLSNRLKPKDACEFRDFSAEGCIEVGDYRVISY